MRAYLSCIALLAPLLVHAVEPIRLQQLKVASPPWPAGDERGMANQLGSSTWQRCAWHMSQSGAQAYELSQVRSTTMPLSPFAGAYTVKPKPTAGIPLTAHAFNTETIGEGTEYGQQGTQFDALGHFASFRKPWDGQPPFPAQDALYYGGFTQREVKPNAESPLQRLGLEKVPPIVTSAVLLDARAYLGNGQPMRAGAVVGAKDIEEMLKLQGLGRRGILPGDVLYVYTGWSEHWRDPDTEKIYYARAPGLSYEAARYLAEKRIVAVGLDTPFIDAVPQGMLEGKGAPAEGTPPALPFAVHHHLISQAGIHHIENARLDELARDGVWTACTLVLPLLEKGAAGSAVRPVAIGVPTRSAGK
jgi:kynurenine formamidase